MRGEKDPGIECQVGDGNTREDRETAARMGDGLSLGVLGGVEQLVEASGLQVDSRLDVDCLDDDFLLNLLDESLGCFVIQEVTRGDQKVGRWEGRRS